MGSLRRAAAAACALAGLGCLVVGGWSAAQFRVATADTESAAGRTGAARPAPLTWLGPQPFVPLIGLLFGAPAGFAGFVALARGQGVRGDDAG